MKEEIVENTKKDEILIFRSFVDKLLLIGMKRVVKNTYDNCPSMEEVIGP